MNILAVDDEPRALRLLVSNILAAVPQAAVADFTSAEEALQWASGNTCDVAFLDVELGTMSGIELGKRLKEYHPKTNLIFVTAYLEYAVSAYAMHASGYLNKPASVESIRAEMENLRYPTPLPDTGDSLVARCFGNFEVFYDGKPLQFKRGKTKELFAFLVDRCGARVTPGEICARLWEDETGDRQQKDYLRHLTMDLAQTLERIGKSEVFVRTRSGYSVDTKLLKCDYYDYLNNVPSAVRAYQGEYMQQYSWAEERAGILSSQNENTV